MLSRAVLAVTSPDIESAYQVSLDDLMVNEVTGKFDFGNVATRLLRASGDMDPRMYEAKQYQARALTLANERLIGLKNTFLGALKSNPTVDLDDVNVALGSTAPTVSKIDRDNAKDKRDAAREAARTQYETTDKAYSAYKKATAAARKDYLVHQDVRRYQTEVRQLQSTLSNSLEKQTRDAAYTAANAAYDLDIQAGRARGVRAVLITQQQALARLEQNNPAVAASVIDFRFAIDNLSQQLVGELGQTDPMRAVITQNLGVHLTRSYEIHHNEGYVEKIKNDPTFAQTRQDARDFFENAWVKRTFKNWRSDDLYAVYSDAEVLSLVRAEAKAKMIGSIELDTFIERHGNTPDVPGRVANKTDLTRFMEKGEVPQELRAVLGEIENPLENALRTYSNVTQFLGTQRLLNQFTKIGRDNGWLITAEDKAREPEKYRLYEPLLNSTKTLGGEPLSNFYAEPQVKETFKLCFSPERKAQLSTAKKAANGLDMVISRTVGVSLSMMTLGSAGFYTRNLLSNVLYMGANGFVATPEKIADALQGLNEIYGTNFWNRVLQVLPENVRPDQKFSYSELGPLGADLIALGLKDTTNVSVIRELMQGMRDSPEQLAAQLEDTLKTFGKTGGAAFEVGKKVLGLVPNTVKTLAAVAESLDLLYKFAYYSHMVKVYTEANAHETVKWTTTQIKQKAARTVRKTSQGRSELPAFAKAFGQSTAGILMNSFFRFTVETVRIPIATVSLATEEIKSGNPVLRRRGVQRLAGLGTVMAFSAVSELIKSVYGFDDKEEQAIRNSMPPWAKNVNYFFKVDPKDPQNIYAWNLTYVHPFSMITDPFIRAFHLIANGRAEESPAVAGSALVGAFMSPQIAVKAFAEVSTNTDSRGGKIWYESDDSLTAGGKIFMHLVRSAYRSKSAGKFYDAFEAYTNQSVYDKEARLATASELVTQEFTPFQTKKFNLVKLARQAFSKIKADQDAVSKERGKFMQAGNMSDEAVADVYGELEKSRLFAAEKLAKTVEGFRSLGIPEDVLARQAEDVGMSRKRFNQIVRQGVVDRVVFAPDLFKDLGALKDKSNGAARVRALKNEILKRPALIPVPK
jgi:hypothetical protein